METHSEQPINEETAEEEPLNSSWSERLKELSIYTLKELSMYFFAGLIIVVGLLVLATLKIDLWSGIGVAILGVVLLRKLYQLCEAFLW